MDNATVITRTTLRIPEKVKLWVKKAARDRGVSENALISLMLQAKMEAEQTAPQ